MTIGFFGGDPLSFVAKLSSLKAEGEGVEDTTKLHSVVLESREASRQSVVKSSMWAKQKRYVRVNDHAHAVNGDVRLAL